MWWEIAKALIFVFFVIPAIFYGIMLLIAGFCLLTDKFKK